MRLDRPWSLCRLRADSSLHACGVSFSFFSSRVKKLDKKEKLDTKEKLDVNSF